MPVKYTPPSVETSHHSVGVRSIERHAYVVHLYFPTWLLPPCTSAFRGKQCSIWKQMTVAPCTMFGYTHNIRIPVLGTAPQLYKVRSLYINVNLPIPLKIALD